MQRKEMAGIRVGKRKEKQARKLQKTKASPLLEAQY